MNETRISYEELNAAGLQDTPVGNFCIDFAKGEVRLTMAYYNPERDDYDNSEYIFEEVEQLSVSGLQINSFEWGAEIQSHEVVLAKEKKAAIKLALLFGPKESSATIQFSYGACYRRV